jgi:cytochrome oxidase assembly protein ShyY1
LVNNHLEYALTWFALAGGLIAIFLLFGFSRGRDREERDAKD